MPHYAAGFENGPVIHIFEALENSYARSVAYAEGHQNH